MAALGISIIFLAGVVFAQQPDLLEMDMRQLLQLEVTTVARKQQKLGRVGAAVYVITQEEIRRSGLRTLPEVLRLAPGLRVAQVGAHQWAISARGFASTFANKLLVLIDGRSVYTPDFGGVFWELQDVMVEEIERIEVIRGPGGTMWGPNAVNGVINIITKSAKVSQGGRIIGGVGAVERGYGSIRYGGTLGSKAWYKAWAKRSEHGAAAFEHRNSAGDSWNDSRGGLRIDWEPGTRDRVTSIVESSRARFRQIDLLPIRQAPYWRESPARYLASTGSWQTSWNHEHRDGSHTQTQVYYDGYNRDQHVFGEQRSTIDFEVQHRRRVARRHEFNWGGGYRHSVDSTVPNEHVVLSPSGRGLKLAGVFFQDEVEVIEDRLLLTAGAKVQHSDFAGIDALPSVRLAFEPVHNHTIWWAASRAARTPARLDHGSSIWAMTYPGTPETGGLPLRIILTGGPEFDSQYLNAWEAGYRAEVSKRLIVDFAAFRHNYNRLRAIRAGEPRLQPAATPSMDIPVSIVNGLDGSLWGTESSVQYRIASWWRVTGVHNWLRGHFALDRTLTGWSTGAESAAQPTQSGSVRSYMDLPGRFQLDVAYYGAGAARKFDEIQNPVIPVDLASAWSRTDVRLGYKLRRNLDLSFRFHNIGKPRRVEQPAELFQHTEMIRRGADMRIEFTF